MGPVGATAAADFAEPGTAGLRPAMGNVSGPAARRPGRAAGYGHRLPKTPVTARFARRPDFRSTTYARADGAGRRATAAADFAEPGTAGLRPAMGNVSGLRCAPTGARRELRSSTSHSAGYGALRA